MKARKLVFVSVWLASVVMGALVIAALITMFGRLPFMITFGTAFFFSTAGWMGGYYYVYERWGQHE